MSLMRVYFDKEQLEKIKRVNLNTIKYGKILDNVMTLSGVPIHPLFRRHTKELITMYIKCVQRYGFRPNLDHLFDNMTWSKPFRNRYMREINFMLSKSVRRSTIKLWILKMIISISDTYVMDMRRIDYDKNNKKR